MVVLVPTTDAERAAALAERLRSGALKQVGLIEVGAGARIEAELAVRIVLADLDHLTDGTGLDPPASLAHWEAVSERLERLERATRTQKRTPDRRQPSGPEQGGLATPQLPHVVDPADAFRAGGEDAPPREWADERSRVRT